MFVLSNRRIHCWPEVFAQVVVLGVLDVADDFDRRSHVFVSLDANGFPDRILSVKEFAGERLIHNDDFGRREGIEAMEIAASKKRRSKSLEIGGTHLVQVRLALYHLAGTL